ncbi:MAG: hypothetical protein Q8L78_01510 [Coxiellaceae bacterium]|nr:hypothetical protein [Coxiellaceae bacterium]
MKIQNRQTKLNYQIYLAKEKWTALEAACYLFQTTPNDNETITYDGYGNLEIQNLEIQEALDAINSWDLSYQTHPFTYVEIAIKKCLLEEIPEKLLSGIKKITDNYSPEELLQFINKHPSLTVQLNLNKTITENNNISPETENPLSKTERKKMYAILLAMAVEKYEYDPTLPKNKATGTNNHSIRASTESIGHSIDDQTIKNYLEKAVELLNYKPIKKK